MKTIEETYRARLKLLTEQHGGQVGLSRIINKSPAQISQWVNGAKESSTSKPRSMKSDTAREIEQALGLPHAWFDQPLEDTGIGNTYAAPDLTGPIPLISWVQAGAWGEIVDNFQPGDAEEWISSTTHHSNNTFALRVSGESMKNDGNRESFEDGDIILADPNRSYQNGSLVVVRLNGDKTATFKKLIIEDDGTMYLRPLNPNWPQQIIPITEEAQICGVVFEKVVRF